MPTQKKSSGGKSYTLDESSTSDSVMVDDVTLEKYGDPVELTDDQYERVSALNGVTLTEADASQKTDAESGEE